MSLITATDALRTNSIEYVNPSFALNIGTLDSANVGSAIAIGREGSVLAPVPRSTTTLRGVLNLSNGNGIAGQVLSSGGSTGSLTWANAGSSGNIQSGETAVGAMSSSVTGYIGYSATYVTKPNIQLTMNLNGTGTTIIPVAVESQVLNGVGEYSGLVWIAGTTSATATISWYVTQ